MCRWSTVRWTAGVLAALLVAMLGTAPASAGTGRGGDGLARARAAVEQAAGALDGAVARAAAADERVVAAQAQLDALRQRQADLSAEEAQATERLRATRAQVRAMALAGYVQGGGALRSVYDLVSAPDVPELLRRGALYDTAGIVSQTGLARLGEAREAAGAVVSAAVAEAERQQAELGAAVRAQTDARAAVGPLQVAVVDAQAALVAVRAAAIVPGTDMTGTLLDAYRGAAALANAEDPSCRVAWWVVAGVGKVESRHARGGRGMRANGDTTGILGPPLDGNDGVALVPDSDGGAADGDPELDRAVGPMQFLPSTWRRWGTDGNSDRRVNANNVFDAAAGAARYLCASRGGVGLDEPAGLHRALLAYNHSEHYVDVVTKAGTGYRDSAIPGWAFDPSA